MNTTRIYLIGIAGDSLDRQTAERLASCVAIVASERMMPMLGAALPSYPRRQIIRITPLAEAMTAIASALDCGDVAVLASGDPLFFGIGEILGRHFESSRITVLPALSAMQLAFSRLALPWQDARFLSLHGRKSLYIAAQILPFRKICILTDNLNTPAVIASKLLDQVSARHLDDFTLFVGEDLGSVNERITTGSLSEIAERDFNSPNILIILQNRQITELPTLGLGEQELAHSRGLITKNEVRAAVLHHLAPPRQGVMWDIGAGSGSISIEAARLSDALQVFAIEKNAEQLEHIHRNREKFQAANIEVIAGAAPEVLTQLPDPDRIFVGGSGGNLAAILDTATNRLKTGGKIIVTAVLAATAEKAPEILYSRGLAVEISKISVERRYFPEPEKTCFNPITLIIGRKIQGVTDAAEHH
jgi:precorrin-6Y C5,15-methyltransferase (decarboxylating)